MFKLTALCRASSALHRPIPRLQKLASSASWSHLAPLLAADHTTFTSCRSPPKGHLEVSFSRSLLHTSSVNKDKFDLADEAQKRYKHMLSEVDWREVKGSPQSALVYGATGLIPFVLPPVAILLNGAFLPSLAFVQLAYGASILSFLGGVKWGFALPEHSPQKLTWENLGQSVTLSLVAFGSLIISPWMGTLTLVAGLGASAYIDITSKGYPQWFKAMRLCLSAVAISSLLLTLLLRMLL